METILWGFMFGAILQYARLNRYDTIAGMAVRQDFTVAKAIAFTVGLGILLLQAEIALGYGDYHVKPLLLAGIAGGGVLFGMGMAILGYCPGTVAVSLGQGYVDALFGILGGLCGALAYAVLYPQLSPLLGPDLGTLSLRSLVPNSLLFWAGSVALAALFMGGALWLDKKHPGDRRWLAAALGLAVLNVLLNLRTTAGHPMGASTAFPFAAMSVTGLGAQAYWNKIAEPGAWELHFLAGAFLAGFASAVVRGSFRLTMVPDLWRRYYGAQPAKRFVWAFIGGFLLLAGARTAGGCTSGHIVSGGMQLAASSLLFAVVVAAAFLSTGRAFYRR
jgi:uncharacterized membrane protein YedE/YeeE